MPNLDFSIDGYLGLLKAYLDRGHRPVSFLDAKSAGDLVIRHDVDFSVPAARTIAEAEAAQGIKASYFFLLTSHFYNVFAEENAQAIEAIRDLGHTVSIHFDPAIHDDLDRAFSQEQAMFSARFSVPVDIISLHRPGAFLNDNNRKLPGVLHTYEDRFFKNMEYVSDSGGGFFRDDPLSDRFLSPSRPVQLLTHPIWWVAPAGTPSDTLRRWQREHFGFLNEQTVANCKTFDGQAG
jgi:hypothetical protein